SWYQILASDNVLKFYKRNNGINIIPYFFDGRMLDTNLEPNLCHDQREKFDTVTTPFDMFSYDPS
ncbi:unnamed protein product, partial [Allacma fusca]